MTNLLHPFLERWRLCAVVVAAAMLATAHAFETFGGYAPCMLCLLQRAGYWAILAHGLAEIASRGRTFDQQALPLFLSLAPQHRRALAEVTIALKNHLEAMQDSISDVRSSLSALTDYLLREEGQPPAGSSIDKGES